MSAENYESLPTERLLEMFVAAAKQHGMGTRQMAALASLRDPLAPSVGPVDLEALKPTFAQLWAVSLALAPREPVVEVERMLGELEPHPASHSAATAIAARAADRLIVI